MVACLLPLAGIAQFDSRNTSDKDTNLSSDSDSTDAPRLRDATTTLLPKIATSPQAEAFQKVGDYTVNNSSGIPDISIPLYEIDHCGYKIPLKLRYIASPLRPSYNYDVTGHGWTLSSGYCITRSVNTMRDEANNFLLHSQVLQSYYRDFETQMDYFNFQNDQFHATLPDGSSFTFYMRRENNQLEYVISNRKQWKITCNVSGYHIESFTVTDNTGVKYYFMKADCALGSQYYYNVAWYLTKIELTNSKTPILFEYNQYIKQTTVSGTTEPILVIERYKVNSTPTGTQTSSLTSSIENPNTNTNYKMPLLTSITYGPTRISFSYQYSDYEKEFNYLDKMTVSDNNTAVKEFRFAYTKQQFHSYPLASLGRLVEKGTVTGTDSLVYAFTYTGVGNMQSTDHWGYCRFNGAGFSDIGNFNAYFESEDPYQGTAGMHYVTAVPDNPLSSIYYKKLKLFSSNVSEDPRQGSDAIWHNYLSSITYPTGGRTEFVFEPHRFVTATNAQGDYTAVKKNRQVIQGGGFRIKKISNYTADGVLADVRTYCYGPTFLEANGQHLNLPINANNNSLNHIGFGEPVVDPNIITYTNFRNSASNPFPINDMLLGKRSYNFYGAPESAFLIAFAGGITWHWECRFSPLFFRSLLRGRNAVVYPEITEYYGDVTNFDATPFPITGKTVYKYNIYNETEDSVYTERIVYYGHVLDCKEDMGRRDWLTEKAVYRYDGTFHLQQKEKYTYQIIDQPPVYDYVFGNIYTPYAQGDYSPYTTVRDVMYDRVTYLTYRNLIQKTDSFFTTTGAYANVESYEYDWNDLLSISSTRANWNKSTSYTYPSASASSMDTELRNRNMMATVLQQKTKVFSNNLIDVSGYKTDYCLYDVGVDSLMLPSQLYRLNASYSGSSFEEAEQVVSYTANGNPIEVIDRSGMHTTYLWSYNDRYLIAEIKNASASQVSSATSSVFGMSITALANANSPNAAQLKNLHSYTGLGSAMVTTWTYNPLVGVASQTDPSGMSTYYDYDGLGRLKEVYRYENNIVSASNKRILNQYNYHTHAQ